MPPHLSDAEKNKIDTMRNKAPKDIIKTLQQQRRRRGEDGPSPGTVYSYLKGYTFKRNAKETRGAPSTLPPNLVKTAFSERAKLCRSAKSEYPVTWADVHKATKAKLKESGAFKAGVKMPSKDYLERVVREQTEIRARPGKRRITRTKEHEEQRFALTTAWRKYPQSWWSNEIHAYIDTTRYVCARNAKDKKRMRMSKVTRHLRTPAEGSKKEFVLPKQNHMLTGIPSVEVTAAVYKNKVIMWHESGPGHWNGEKAAKMYHELGKVLRKVHGNKKFFRVVEDGDPKGFQSTKGIRAKQEEKIRSWKLSPHSPGLMPWDYCLWDEVEDRVLKKRKLENESVTSYKKRLCLTAKRLPKKLVGNVIKKMKSNIEAIYQNEGGYTKLD